MQRFDLGSGIGEIKTPHRDGRLYKILVSGYADIFLLFIGYTDTRFQRPIYVPLFGDLLDGQHQVRLPAEIFTFESCLVSLPSVAHLPVAIGPMGKLKDRLELLATIHVSNISFVDQVIRMYEQMLQDARSAGNAIIETAPNAIQIYGDLQPRLNQLLGG